MKEYWVLACWVKGNKYYYNPRPEIDAKDAGITHFNKDWLESNPYFCKQFKSESDAITQLKDGRNKNHWGGVFQVERIFVSR